MRLDWLFDAVVCALKTANINILSSIPGASLKSFEQKEFHIFWALTQVSRFFYGYVTQESAPESSAQGNSSHP